MEVQEKRYGFWIIPENDFYKEMEGVIQKYAQEYNSPVFQPHMTILGVVASDDIYKVVETVKKVARSVKPFDIEVGNVEFSTTYFQCVFARMKTSAAMLNTHLELKSGFGVEEMHVFMPHASLVYGDYDMETREKISGEITLVNKSFVAQKITIVHADTSDPKDWGVVEQVNLS